MEWDEQPVKGVLKIKGSPLSKTYNLYAQDSVVVQARFSFEEWQSSILCEGKGSSPRDGKDGFCGQFPLKLIIFVSLPLGLEKGVWAS